MEFKTFNKRIQKQFAKMCETGKLFRANVSGQELWDIYLSSFEDEQQFRDPESSEHNCNCCKNFVRRYGNIVSINSSGEIETIFTGIGDVGEYTSSVLAVDAFIESTEIKNVFFETYNELNLNLNYEACNKTQETYKLGIESNFKKYNQEEVEKFGVVNVNDVYEFPHFCIFLPKRFVDFSGGSIERITALYRDKYSVFKRAMEEIPLDTLNLVKDLINQGSLLDGNAHLHSVQEITNWKEIYDRNPNKNWLWWTTYEMDERVAKFKNTLIGVLCTELAEGEELNKACLNWNKRVDPANYHKAVAPITKKQIKEAKAFVEANGYEESFDRRLATIDDIKASEVKHINVGEGNIQKVSIFDSVKSTSTRHKRSEFDKLEEVSIEKFMKDILPSCSSVEAYLENRMDGNLSVMTTSNNDNSKPIFKWKNNYSWTFNGNLAGKSQIKEAVKTAGGAVNGILRFSIMWAEKDNDNSDLDAHCQEPSGGTHIYFSQNLSRLTGGNLDIDITQPNNQMPNGAVENITYPSMQRMIDGTYIFHVNQYSGRNSKGFKAEIEFNGETYSYEFNQPVRGNVPVAEVNLKDGEFSIKHRLPETNSSKELWGLETKNFHKVNLACLSPNHWDDNAIGNLHYFFMLDKCVPKNQIRGFHNENLIPELLKHRKVMEVLGTTNMIEPNGKQLAGIGFNSTVKDELIIKCSGNFKRMLKVKF